MASACECFGPGETCDQCYRPPADPPTVRPVRAIWDLPVFGWAWTEDGQDHNG